MLVIGSAIGCVVGACSEFVPGCEGGDFYAWADGTSAAAPHVAGAGAVSESNQAGNQSPGKLEQCLLMFLFFFDERRNGVGSSPIPTHRSVRLERTPAQLRRRVCLCRT